MDPGTPLPIPHAADAGFRAAPAIAVALVAAIPLVGRTFLGWFPAGLPGRHAPRELPATFAASYLIGALWFGWIGTVVVQPEVRVYVAFGVPLLALIARMLTSPSGLVPRHEPVAERASASARAAIVVAALAVAVVAAYGESSGHGWIATGLEALAAAILAHSALATALVTAWARVAVLAVVCASIGFTPYEDDGSVRALLGTCGVALGAVAWIRRGDRRGLALASAGVAYLALLGPHGYAIAATTGVAIVIGSAKPSRRRALVWVAAAFVAGILPRLGRGPVGPLDGSRAPGYGWVDVALLALVAAAFLAAGALRRRGTAPETNPSGAPESREAHVLAFGAVGAWLFVAVSWQARVGVPCPTLSIWSLLAIAAAIALTRALERAPTPS